MVATVVSATRPGVASQRGLSTIADLLFVFFEAAQSIFNQYKAVESGGESGWR